ncbi:nucleotidyltransferase [Flavobacterium sp. DG1-102-2]|uniref:nucleotidyltransferase domain-containing protein n=1 Tax=Flavobacterium sp. DG1-102-2 TaxID=3081663 RepID=UPI00294A220E|nr:nucleotidyltransferase [Flavobacterium sp. DG1-102-2]MDV6169362.1 nucleotidyltransferase [Flavobacterium sp. DG1-102-2]
MQQLYKTEISKFLEELGKELDITRTEYEGIVKSYGAVGDWLSHEESSLKKYSPNILPQGSFMLGTIIRPVNPEEDIDIDLVCKLNKKPDSWTQKHLKTEVGNRLKSHGDYNRMLKDYKDGEYYDEGGRRCWTLKYSDAAGYHMDILPAVTCNDLAVLMERTFSADTNIEVDNLAIRLTDKEKDNYSNDSNVDNWNKSNPFGYAEWFFRRALISKTRMFSLNESVDPVRVYEEEKLPLQRVVQLLKRHRDIMFSSKEYDCENKPISIIITTLASMAYDKSQSLIDAYSGIVSRMRSLIEERHNPETGKTEKWVANPINKEENFADKWSEVKQKQDYFYKWLDKLEKDLARMTQGEGRGLQFLNESFSNMYGNEVTKKVFSNYGNNNTLLRNQGQRVMAQGTGMLGAGSVGVKVPKHDFEGNNGE